jgi:hypothetical protein
MDGRGGPLSNPLRRDGRLGAAPFPQAVRTTVHIDSRDRDHAVHPSSSSFVVDLPEGLNNVASCVLVNAELPLSYYVFAAERGNTTVLVSVDGGAAQAVTVPDGNYTTAAMAAALKAALEAAFAGSTFEVSFSAVTMKCTITVTGGGAALAVDTTGAARPTDWGLAYYLGFARGAVTAGTGAVTGAFVANLNPENYLLLDIEEINGVSQAALYNAGGSGRKTFAKIQLQGDQYQYNFYDNAGTAVHLRPQLAKLERLRVSVRFHDGSLVNLNGAEWSMSIEFGCTLARGQL